MTPWLSILIGLPMLCGVLLLCVRDRAAPPIALLASLVCLACCIPLLQEYDFITSAYQFVEHYAWFPAFDIWYTVGVDGFSLAFILLTCMFSPFVVCSAWGHKERTAQYLAAFFFLQGTLVGVFAAMDSILFYLFWEAMLIPMFLLIGIWGGAARVYATMKFFVYTFFGSIFLLVAILCLHHYAQAAGVAESFAIRSFHSLPLPMSVQVPLFFAMLLAFAIKIPMFPVHTWLPDAHVQAPTGGSVMLAAILLKLGGYGILRFVLPIVPDAARLYQWPMIILSLVAVIYIGLIALVQSDLKKLVAYSSIAHMGFVTLGLFIALPLVTQGAPEMAAMAVEGAMMQMLSHGLISGALFLCVGLLYSRRHSREIREYGGVAEAMPVFAALFVFFCMANTGLPGTSGFVGECLVIFSAFQVSGPLALLAGTTLVLSAGYMLWMVQRVVFGPVVHPEVGRMRDLSRMEFVYLLVLAAAILVVGLWPAPILDLLHPATTTLLQQFAQTKL